MKQTLREFNTPRAILLALSLCLPAVLLFVLIQAAVALNGGLVVDLGGVDGGYSATFTEDGGEKSIVSVDGLTVSGAESDTILSAEAKLTNHPDGDLESLSADAGTTGITVELYKPGSGLLRLEGSASMADYQHVLQTLKYNNESQSLAVGVLYEDRIVLVTVEDSLATSEPVASTIAINPVNDAPILDNSGNMRLTNIQEGEVDSLGDQVADIIGSAETGGEDRITDVDDGAVEGLAIIEAATGNGVWQYSTTGGTAWTEFVAVSNTAAVLLDTTARIRFVPIGQFNGSAGIRFRAWDQTTGSNGNTGVDVSSNGGDSAFSLADETAEITVQAVNDLPVVDLNGPDPGFDYSTAGSPANIAGPQATITDADNPLLAGAVFTLTNRLDGSAEVLSADTLTTTITAAPYDPVLGILKLSGSDSIENYEMVLRTVTYANTAGSPSEGVRVVEVVVNDGIDSSDLVTSSITINKNNQAPILNQPGPYHLDNVEEDTLEPAGNTVTETLHSITPNPVSDPDPEALLGIAVTGVDDTHGQWEYVTSGMRQSQMVWLSFEVVSDTSAVLLDAEALIRFVPDADYDGPSGSLAFRAWDQTSGASGGRANTIPNGGATAFSTQTGTAVLTVIAVNDAPVVIQNVSPAPVFVEDKPPINVFSPSLKVDDVDDDALASATITITNPLNGSHEQLLVSLEPGMSSSYTNGVLTLRGAVSPAAYQKVLGTVRYQNTSPDPDPGDRNIVTTVSDDEATSLSLETLLAVLPVNDPPVLDLNGTRAGVDFRTKYEAGTNPEPIADSDMTVSDVDSTALISVSIKILNPMDGTADILNFDVSGTNIKANSAPGTGVLELEGQDSLENYERVLRTLTYENNLERPNKTDRIIEFTAYDDDGGVSKVSTTFVSMRPKLILFPMIAHRGEEPNDSCNNALDIHADLAEVNLYTDDASDWFRFQLDTTTAISVELTSFADDVDNPVPGAGQLLVVAGDSCKSLTILGHNGDDLIDRQIEFSNGNSLPAGRYYIWVIYDGPADAVDQYHLMVRTTP